MGLFKKKNVKDDIPVVLAAAVMAASEDEDLPVVLAAAVAAYESDHYKSVLAIRKINRVAGVRPVWGIMGTTESIDVRRI